MTDISWRDVPCTGCGAPVKQNCFSRTGKVALEPHAARRQAAREAGLPTPVLGYPRQAELPHIVSLADKTRALCSAVIETIPEIQPPLHTACPKCRNLLGKIPYRRDTAVTGVCPVCVSDEDLDDEGRIKPHKQMLGTARTDIDCGGAGEFSDGDG